MEFISSYHLEGFIIGLCTFLVIGLFHPLVIKAEYYFGTRCWWVFLLFGIIGIAGTFYIENMILSALCGVFGFSSFWSIGEVFQQKKRVEKGWFPKRNKK
jgi:hypothetical protein